MKAQDILSDIKKNCDVLAGIIQVPVVDAEKKSEFDNQVSELKQMLAQRDTEIAALNDHCVALMKELAALKITLQEHDKKPKKEK